MEQRGAGGLREARQQMLSEPFGLVAMRVAGENERLDAETHVLAQLGLHLIVAADDGRAAAAAPAPDARPEEGVGPLALRQQRVLARFADRVPIERAALDDLAHVVGQAADQAV